MGGLSHPLGLPRAAAAVATPRSQRGRPRARARRCLPSPRYHPRAAQGICHLLATFTLACVLRWVCKTRLGLSHLSRPKSHWMCRTEHNYKDPVASEPCPPRHLPDPSPASEPLVGSQAPYRSDGRVWCSTTPLARRSTAPHLALCRVSRPFGRGPAPWTAHFANNSLLCRRRVTAWAPSLRRARCLLMT